MGCSVCPHTSVRLQRAQPLHKGMPITHAPHCPLSAKSPAVFGDACVRARLRACVCVTICCGVRCSPRCSENGASWGRVLNREGIRGYWGRKRGCALEVGDEGQFLKGTNCPS